MSVQPNYLMFHTGAELFSVSVAFGVFFIAWNTRHFSRNGYYVWIGTTYLYLGLIDLIHALAYKGMGVFPGDDPNLPTQLWVGARYLEGLALVFSYAFVRRAAPPGMHLGFAAVTAAILSSILVFDAFPDCYVEGVGLTTFKVVSEYIIIALFGASAAFLLANPTLFDARDRRLLLAMFALKMLAEFFFTTYGDVFDGANALGHIIKIVAFYLLYRVTIRGALIDPYHSLFSDLRAARDVLESSDRRFRLAIRPAPVAVFSQDAALRFSWMYNGRVLGLPHKVEGMSDAELFHPREAASLTRLKDEVLATGKALRRQIKLRDKAFDLTLEPLRNAGETTVGIVSTAIDISELVQARAEAERANQSKSRFLAAASHDLRQPFQAMRLFHHLLVSKLTDPYHLDVAAKLAEAMEAGESLLNSLLDISTLEAGNVQAKPTDVALADVIGRVVREIEPQAAEKGVVVRWVAPRATVHSDPVLLARMLRNLAANAVRYTDAGRILIGCRRKGASVRVEVWDTGQGIPPGKVDAIFEDFYQIGNPERDRTRGLGLGLSIVSRVGSLLEHPVAVCSEEGRGSVFSITVPLAGRGQIAPDIAPPAEVAQIRVV